MKVSGAVLATLPLPGSSYEEDWACHTTLLVAGEWLMSIPAFPAYAEGDAFGLRIPSGELRGKVRMADVDTEHDSQRVWLDAHWEGSYAGLTGGLSAHTYFQFDAPEGTLAETSAYPLPVPWGVLSAAHALVDWGDMGLFDLYGQPERKREYLHDAIDALLVLRARYGSALVVQEAVE